MKLDRIISLLSTLLALGIVIFFSYTKFLKCEDKKLYHVELPANRNISQYVYSSGILEIKNPVKIGSVISGTVKKLYVKENEFVKKGQLLAEIDPGTGDTDYHVAQEAFHKEHSKLQYRTKHFARLKALHKAGQVAHDAIDQQKQLLEAAQYDYNIAKTKLEKEKLLLNARKITAVADGVITEVNITNGSGVSGADVSHSEPLFEVAPDITDMEAKLNIDESDIGEVRAGAPVKFTVNTYPDHELISKITEVGYSPKAAKRSITSAAFYKATMEIDNDMRCYRPGMALNAKIRVAEAKNALSIRGLAFQTDPCLLKKIAHALNYTFEPLPHESRKRICKEHCHTHTVVKFIWVDTGKSFAQRAITLGITDGNFFEIKKGLKPGDKVVTDLVEEGVLEKKYKKHFSLW